MRLFPDVLSRVSQGSLLEDWRAVPDWRVVPNKICRQPSHAWMQSLVLSYATWVKTCLDKRNRNLVRPGDVSEHDLGLADMLLKLNLECFPEELDADQAVRHRAHFAVTAAAIKLNRLVDPRYDAQRRGELQAELEAATRRAVFDPEWLGDRHKAESTNEHPRTPLEKLIFGREDLALRAARSIRTKLDTLASR